MSGERDGVHGIDAVSLLEPLSRVANVNSLGLDTVENDSATILINLGDTIDPGFAVVVEESDTFGSGYAPVADATIDLIGDTVPVGGTVDTVFKIGYVGDKRFVRVALTIPGATKVGVIGIKGHLHRTPVADKS